MHSTREIKYLTADEVARLRRYAEARAVQAIERGTVGSIREWALLDTLLCSGLRASEVAGLQVQDLLLGYGQSAVLVQHGKGDKRREVFIPLDLKQHLKRFIEWKAARGESVEATAPVFLGQRGRLTRHGVWRIVKGLMRSVGLDPRYAAHSLRHSYAVGLYRASGADLEVVQEQLGHADVRTTTIYAKTTKEDKQKAADNLAKAYRDSQRSRQSGASWPKRVPVSPTTESQKGASSSPDVGAGAAP